MADARLFVSHSHFDDVLGLRLIQDLRAHLGDVAVWYDASGGLQVGDDWWKSIRDEISFCNYFLVILSPEAMASKWVPQEMNLAFYLNVQYGGKTLLPLLYKSCTLPVDWQRIHGIKIADPAQDATSYQQGLAQVLQAVGAQFNAAPTKPTYSEDGLYQLYKHGLEAKNGGQWEQAEDAWNKVLTANPQYNGGSLAKDMEEVKREVTRINIERLRGTVQQAKVSGDLSKIVYALYGLVLADHSDEATRKELWASGVAKADAEHRRGAWDDEIATWELLLRVLPSYNYASRRKAIAEQNQQYVQMYRLARDMAREGKRAQAAEQLTKLWQRDRAPYYGDPSGIAPALGLQVPSTYDVVMAEKARKKVELSKTLDDVNSKLAKLRYDPRAYNNGWLVGLILGIITGICIFLGGISIAGIFFGNQIGGLVNVLVVIELGFTTLLSLTCLILGPVLGIKRDTHRKRAFVALTKEQAKLRSHLSSLPA